MTPTFRNLARVLALTVVLCFAGTMLGPVIRGGFGYMWGYLGGIFGPLALAMLGVAAFVWWAKGERYREARDAESAQDPGAFDPAGRLDLGGPSDGSREARRHTVRRRARRDRRAPATQR